MRPAVFALSLVALPVLGFAGTACSHSDETETPAANLADVNFEEGASDEALEALLAKPVDAKKSVPVTVPAAKQVFAKSPVPLFTWEEAKTAALPMKKPGSPSRFFVFEREAWAHGTPMNGAGYFLVFKSSSGNLARVFTGTKSYLPTADVWAKLVPAKDVTLTITAGVFEDNALVAGSGPFVSATIPFTVTP